MKLFVWILLSLALWKNAGAIRCWTCNNARSNNECQRRGSLQTCLRINDVCHNEFRRGLYGSLITKRCKQPNACANNQIQNPRLAWHPTQCNTRVVSSVCRCCCANDGCNAEVNCRPVQQECGVQVIDPILDRVRKIARGIEARPHSFPWQVLIKATDGGICGGSIVNPTTIVTAAHCLVMKNGTRIPTEMVYAGIQNQEDEDGVSVTVARELFHREYLADNRDEIFFHDIAIVKLSRPLEFGDTIQPICLPYPEEVPSVGDYCVITGWGAEYEYGSGSDELQQAEIQIADDNTCLRVFNRTFYDPRLNICAGGDHSSDTCQGDSGGPLQCKRANGGAWYLAGVTSWGVGCGEETPGVYTEVSRYMNWINRRL